MANLMPLSPDAAARTLIFSAPSSPGQRRISFELSSAHNLSDDARKVESATPVELGHGGGCQSPHDYNTFTLTHQELPIVLGLPAGGKARLNTMPRTRTAALRNLPVF